MVFTYYPPFETPHSIQLQFALNRAHVCELLLYAVLLLSNSSLMREQEGPHRLRMTRTKLVQVDLISKQTIVKWSVAQRQISLREQAYTL